MNIKEFEKLPILGILRGIEESMVEPLVQCVINSGLKTIEITMNTEEAGLLIRKMVSLSHNQLTIGAGTVLTIHQLQEAMDAGATFIVSPIINEDLVNFCAVNNIPVFPGALTPNEIYKAWNLGASMVKVFPAKTFGPAYFKEIKAPLNSIKLMATGGVSVDNVREFVKNGADAISFGASIFKQNWMRNNEYHLIENEIKKLIQNYLDS